MRLAAALIAGAALWIAVPAAAQTVVLVRHAEKADRSGDPDLSEAGLARAEALSEALSGTPLTHILVTPLQRTSQTASPTAHAQGLTLQPVSIDGGAAHVERVVATVRQLPEDAVVLIVGHSNTVPEIARGLGAVSAADMNDCEFDRLTMIELRQDNAPVVVTSRYGAQNTRCADR